MFRFPTSVVVAVVLAAALIRPAFPCPDGALSLDTRVDAFARLESVRAPWRAPSSRPADLTELRERVRGRVVRDLRRSAALERVFDVRIDAGDVQAELARMARDTHAPGRLRALFAALDDDPVLIAETLVRPILVEREISRRVAPGERRAWWRSIDEASVACAPAIEGADDLTLPSIDESPCDDDTWRPIAAAPLAERHGHTAVWTGAEMIVWGGTGTASLLEGGARYDPATDAWALVSEEGGPGTPYDHTAVWTGSEMIVWGGSPGAAGGRSRGGRYDPVSDTWTPTRDDASTPLGRYWHSAVWTGTEMIVFGGHGGRFMSDVLDSGSRYDPATDTWIPTPRGGPSARDHHTAVWGAGGMIVWGGADRNVAGELIRREDGARYDPLADEWLDTTRSGGPERRTNHAAVWADPEMIVWGGSGDEGVVANGARHAPDSDSWTKLPADGSQPSARQFHTAAWTGTDVLVWGGLASYSGGPFDSGGRYLRSDDAWRPTAIDAHTPVARHHHTAVWTGREMIVWGGTTDSGDANDGAAYCALCTWYPDLDADGFGDGDAPSLDVCTLPAGFSESAGDCDDASSDTHPGAAEINDGRDNQCPGEEGAGLVDEVEGVAGFTDPSNDDAFCWEAQPGASEYEAARSISPTFDAPCETERTSLTCWVDATEPEAGRALHYLVRSVAPHVGSWGARSDGAERTAVCE